ncbi:YciI family protein [Actinotalea sp. M2MS4P-6]|uniref:YciI family protein n=1 Tax=Actinotalea sp. M2MS4P-6 TaxID=2983762 RepID=UPI0021E45366|nr:YciI family protein [Actinotalea sp. M2MS4P-6]MCV2392741.1 YciI family protein [Actinotalea sp. M2MS4P-6]
MHLIELALHDTPERIAARPAHREKQRLLHEAGVVLISGPLASGDGAFIVVDGDRDAVDAMLADDPYYARDDVEVLRILEWAPAFRC